MTDSGTSEKEILVFRDGLAIERVGPGYKVFVRSQPFPGDFNELTQALADFQAGQVAGNCRSRMVPRPEESFTWFGKGRRQNTFLVGTNFVAPCPEDTESLILALLKFFLNSGGESRQTVELHD